MGAVMRRMHKGAPTACLRLTQYVVHAPTDDAASPTEALAGS